MTLADTGRFFKRATESTTAFLRRVKPPIGSNNVLVGGFIGSAATATEIIERGINGQPLSIWHGVKFMFFFTMACCHSHSLWKTDPKIGTGLARSESEFFKQHAK